MSVVPISDTALIAMADRFDRLVLENVDLKQRLDGLYDGILKSLDALRAERRTWIDRLTVAEQRIAEVGATADRCA